MKTLREEIQQYIYSCLDYGELAISMDTMTTEILSKIEKRIDVLKQEHGNTDEGYRLACVDMKEMLDLNKKKKRILKVNHCCLCGKEILAINRTKTAKCEDCFLVQMNIYRRGFR